MQLQYKDGKRTPAELEEAISLQLLEEPPNLVFCLSQLELSYEIRTFCETTPSYETVICRPDSGKRSTAPGLRGDFVTIHAG